MRLCNKKTYLLYFNALLLLSRPREVEMKSYIAQRTTKDCKSIDEDGLCTCDNGYKTCIFEDKSGDPDPWDSYKKCVNEEYTNSCCPSGWSYNEHSLDVNCVGFNEKMIGRSVVNEGKKKICGLEDYPSCRTESKGRNKPTIIHNCQIKSKPCNGRCYKGMLICLSQQKCFPRSTWTTFCNFAEQTQNASILFPTHVAITNMSEVPTKMDKTTNYNGLEPKTKFEKNADENSTTTGNKTTYNSTKKETNSIISTGVIIGSSVGGVVLIIIVIIICMIIYKKYRTTSTDRTTLINEESVDQNPDYGYGEAGDDVEIVDFNPYYMEPDEEGVAEVVEYNPLYGIGTDSMDE